jgi:hypothetical protein
LRRALIAEQLETALRHSLQAPQLQLVELAGGRTAVCSSSSARSFICPMPNG